MRTDHDYCPDQELNPPQSETCEDCGYILLNGHCANCEEWDRFEAEADRLEDERLVELAELENNEKYIFNK